LKKSSNENYKVLFFDGAFGTYYRKISGKNANCEFANINDRETVYKIHIEYINAGSNAIKTNTFGANSLLSTDFNLISEVIHSGFEIASAVALENNAKVFADIGYINSDDASVSDEYVKIAKIFHECGAKRFIFETLAEYEMLVPAIDYIKTNIEDAFIIVSFAVMQDGYTQKGHYYKKLIDLASKNKNIDVIGLNCICGPSHIFNLIKKLDLTNISFSAMPNSGYPSKVNGRTVFEDNAEYFAGRLLDIFELGVKTIGGCCGTTPEHIRLALKKISKIHKMKPVASLDKLDGIDIVIRQNSFKDKFELSKKVIALELDPPIDTDCEYIISASKKAKIAGVDIVTVADSPLARTRADSIIISAKIKREVDIEVLPHLSCRDRNHIGIKSSLMGASIENINNILVVTGDPISQIDRADYKGVFSFNSFNLISYISSLNSEVFNKSPFYICGALNVNSPQFENELKRAEQKVENGATALLTQPLFSDEAIYNLSLAKEKLNCKILAGILPIASYKNAMFLNNEVSGINIPKSFMDNIIDKSVEEVYEISVKFSLDIMNKAYDICDGFYIMTPLKKIDLVCEIIKKIRKD
jgi:homocysteine S-methyltransferase